MRPAVVHPISDDPAVTNNNITRLARPAAVHPTISDDPAGRASHVPQVGNTQNNKVLFISGEMNRIDMVGYVKRFPKFSKLPILFMGDYIENDPLVILESVLSEGYDCVLVDSFAEVAVAVVDYHGGTMKTAETKILNLLEKHNQAGNRENKNTSFMLIQQVTKGGNFAGSNRFKHMLTGMFLIKFDSDGGRYIFASKNRRGGEMNKLFFSLNQDNHVGWLYTEPVNLAI